MDESSGCSFNEYEGCSTCPVRESCEMIHEDWE